MPDGSESFNAELGTCTLFTDDPFAELHPDWSPDGDRIVSYGTDGRFTLGVAGGHRLQSALSPPKSRVVVGDESEPFVRDGRNVFAKFVRRVDPAVRPGDEVLVEHFDGDLLAVGRAELSADAMTDFDTGMAVKVRNSISG